MSFGKVLDAYDYFDFEGFFSQIRKEDVMQAIRGNSCGLFDCLTLLSPEAEPYLEEMAVKAKDLTLRNFGRTVLLFTPLYLANYCSNHCVYCGFNVKNRITRTKLNDEEIEREAAAIAAQGFNHIIILTGESRIYTPVSYIENAVRIIKRHINSISVEIYPLSIEEYRVLADAGVDGLTLFQEVYNREEYRKLHLSGPKTDYENRLDAPERAAAANLRTVNIGALLGLGDWRKESFFTALHADYLQNKYPGTEISVSFPRVRPQVGDFMPTSLVSDRNLLQMMLAYRIFMPRGGVTVSTRERAYFRDHIVGLGVTKMSAGAVTNVGGHAESGKTSAQFEISDDRSATEIAEMLISKGYQPVFKDWHRIGEKA